jgi:hypothetical protein
VTGCAFGAVLENGLRIAEVTGADADVVTWFVLFHYSPKQQTTVAEITSP